MNPAIVGALTKAIPAIMKVHNALGMVDGIIKTIGGDVEKLAKTFGGRWYEMNDIAFKTARTMAMSREEAVRYNKQLIDSTRELAAQYGITAKELADFQKSYAEAVGRNVVLTREQLSHMSALSKITDDATAATLVDEFDKIGLSVKSTLVNVGHFQEKAKAFGVNTTKATKSLASNIKLASSYSFKNGVADIERMTLQSTALRANMESIMRSSEKFNSVEGAIETSAKLQMLGGSVGAFGANPMGNMYDALADPAKYADNIAKIAKSFVTYDKKTGEVKMNPVQSMMAGATADALGLSKKELADIGFAGVKDEAVKQQVGNKGFTKEQMAAIQNLARGNFNQETGKYQISWIDEQGEHTKNVEEITAKELKIAQDSQATEENMMVDVKDIKRILERVHGRARETKSMKEGVEGAKSWWDAQIVNIQDKWMKKPISNIWNGITNWLGKQYYADGGIVEKPIHAEFGTIVPGDSYMGDHTPVMANGGEMILNPMQQKSMFNLISTLALTGGASKVGSMMGVKGLGTTTLMASALGGGDPSIKNFVEAYFLKKFIKNMIPLKENIGEISKVTEAATKSTSLFKENWKELTNTLHKDWSSFTRRISITTKRYFTTGKLGTVTRGVGNIASAVGTKTAQFGSYIGKYAKSIGETIGRYTIKPISSGISKGWEGLKNSKLGVATQTKIGDAQLKLLRAKLGYRDLVKPKLNEYSKLVRNLFNDGSKAQASKAASRAVAKAGVAAKGGKILSTIGKAGKFLGKAAGPIGAALAIGSAVSDMSSASSQYDAKIDEIEKSGMSELDKARAKDRATKEKNATYGNSIGTAAGAAIGGTLGMALGPLGAIAGGWLGSKVGGFLGKGVGGLFGGSEEKKFKQEQKELFGSSVASGDNTDLLKTVKSIDSKMPSRTSIAAKSIALSPLAPIEMASAAIKALPDLGIFKKVSPSKNEEKVTQASSIGKTDINLNVSGTIKLEGGGKSVDFDLAKLIDTPEFKRQLSDIITKKLNENSNNGKVNMESARNNMANQYNRSGS